MQICKHFAEKN